MELYHIGRALVVGIGFVLLVSAVGYIAYRLGWDG